MRTPTRAQTASISLVLARADDRKTAAAELRSKIPTARALVVPGELRSTGLRLHPGISSVEWQELGTRLRDVERGWLWWVGDWLVYGEHQYGDKYAALLAETGYDYQTVADAKWVTSRFEFSRRRENLSWSHHREVAALDPDEADQWLDRAATEHWSQKALRAEIKQARAKIEVAPERAPLVVAVPAVLEESETLATATVASPGTTESEPAVLVERPANLAAPVPAPRRARLHVVYHLHEELVAALERVRGEVRWSDRDRFHQELDDYRDAARRLSTKAAWEAPVDDDES